LFVVRSWDCDIGFASNNLRFVASFPIRLFTMIR